MVSCAAIWMTESAECSRSACRSGYAPRRISAMISVPEAWQSPRMPGSLPSWMIAAVSSVGKVGSVCGKYPQSNGTGTAAISQWPDGVSLPLEISSAAPKEDDRIVASGDAAGCLAASALAEAQRQHVRNVERSSAQAVAVGAPRAGFGDMAECIGTGIAEALRIGCTAYAEGIKYEQKCAAHGISGSLLPVWP